MENIENKEIKQQANPYLIPGAIVLASIFIVGAIIMTKDSNDGFSKEEGVDFQKELERTVTVKSWENTNGNQVGNPDALVVINEYSDYACPFCARFWEQTLPQIKENYIDTGQVLFIYKDFPVVGGDRAAEAAHCASEQGAFWEYHDLLFSRTQQDRSLWGNTAIHREYAKFLGLDEEELSSCFEERRYRNKVLEYSNEAHSAGGTGTPFFIINGRTISGAQPFGVFQQIIEQKLDEN